VINPEFVNGYLVGISMFRLTALLLVGMFLTLVIAGEDRGQLRPGLARAALEPQAETVATAPVDEVVRVVAAAPADAASASKAAKLAKPAATLAAAVPAPAATAAVAVAVEAERVVVQEVNEVFTLANLATEEMPSVGATEPVPENAVAETTLSELDGVEGQIMYVTARSVNVRAGPSTETEVLGSLGSGEAALVVSDIDGEWARIVIQGDGMEGYVALRFLTAESP